MEPELGDGRAWKVDPELKSALLGLKYRPWD